MLFQGALLAHLVRRFVNAPKTAPLVADQAPAAAADHTTGLQAEGDECPVHYVILVPSTLDAVGRELLQASRTFSWDRLLRQPDSYTHT